MGKFFDAFKDKYEKFAQAEGAGGCDTCGYGAEDVISDYYYEDMLKEMDQWIEQNFGKEKS